jgi:hypothetical protein
MAAGVTKNRTLAECIVDWQALIVAATANPSEHSDENSACGKCRITHDLYGGVSVVLVQKSGTEDVLAVVLRDDDRSGYSLITGHAHGDFLCCPDTLMGQTVVKLATGELATFVSEGEGFIWVNIAMSPGGEKLAVYGCYWAWPYGVMVYDFRNPMTLPLPELAWVDAPSGEDYAHFEGWADSDTLIFRTKNGTEFRSPVLTQAKSQPDQAETEDPIARTESRK